MDPTTAATTHTIELGKTHIAEQEARVAEQRDRVAELERHGHDALHREAEQFLGQMLELLASMKRDVAGAEQRLRDHGEPPAHPHDRGGDRDDREDSTDALDPLDEAALDDVMRKTPL